MTQDTLYIDKISGEGLIARKWSDGSVNYYRELGSGFSGTRTSKIRQLHRIDGPAMCIRKRPPIFVIDGQFLTEADHQKKVAELYPEKKVKQGKFVFTEWEDGMTYYKYNLPVPDKKKEEEKKMKKSSPMLQTKFVMETSKKSTFVREVNYNLDTHELTVALSEGRYLYRDVPVATVRSWIKSDSFGRFFQRKIKGKFVSEKL